MYKYGYIGRGLKTCEMIKGSYLWLMKFIFPSLVSFYFFSTNLKMKYINLCSMIVTVNIAYKIKTEYIAQGIPLSSHLKAKIIMSY